MYMVFIFSGAYAIHFLSTIISKTKNLFKGYFTNFICIPNKNSPGDLDTFHSIRTFCVIFINSEMDFGV
jgi:hypothetical protein